jgi:hypothetical protein
VAFTQEHYEDADDPRVPKGDGGLGFEWFTFDGRSTNLSVETRSFLPSTSRLRTCQSFAVSVCICA